MQKKNNVISLTKEKKRREKVIKKTSLKERVQNAAKTSFNSKNKKSAELIIKVFMSALKCKDDYTWGHSLRVAYFCDVVGREIGLNKDELYELEVSALFHDIGKIGLSDQILLKPSRLDEQEFQEMKLHPEKSAQLLEEFPIFKKVSLNAKHHHERYDGRGYPMGLKGEAIPLFARIILIADTFDAMTSTRPYRDGLSFDIAFQELRDFSGSQFDPVLVERFIASISRDAKQDGPMFKLSIIPGEYKKIAA